MLTSKASLAKNGRTIFIQSMLFVFSAVLLYVLFHYTALNVRVSNFYFDASLPGFPLRHDPVLQNWLHDDLRKLLWLSPLTAFAFWLYSLRTDAGSLTNRRWLWLLLTQLLATLLVSFLKSHTSPICPWDEQQFGGRFHEPVFAFVSSLHSGHCFPAGHPSGGWALLAWAYFLRESKPGWSRVAFWSALLLGALMAWVQIARGAHLLSHVLWSLWVCWLVVWLAYVLAWPSAKAANASDSP